jgi:hypothetical protein
MESEYLIEITVMGKFFRIKYIENLKLKMNEIEYY